jgi:hypothetical protein
MHWHEMQQSNIYLGIYIIEYYFFWKNQGVTSYCLADADAPAYACAPSRLCGSLAQGPSSPTLESS